jgi:hypothetical protein
MKIYRQNEKYKDYHKITQKKYTQSKRGKKWLIRYRLSDASKNNKKKYRDSQKGKDLRLIWLNTVSGKRSRFINRIKRRESENNSEHHWSSEEYQLKLLKTKGICIVCNKPYSKTRIHMDTPDHTFSVIQAGKFYNKYKTKWIYTIDGIIPMGFNCNIIKNDTIPNYIERILQLDDPTTADEAIKIIKKYERQVNNNFIIRCQNM